MCEEQQPTVVYLGLGTNLGDRWQNLRTAVDELRCLAPVRVLQLSSVYETAPWGYADQPQFLNLVAKVQWSSDPISLLEVCQDIERRLGRKRDGHGPSPDPKIRWGPRPIDVDVLLFGEQSIDLPQLVVPHPRMHQRAFVMVPLAELSPDLRVHGKATREWAAQLQAEQGVLLVGPL